MTCFMGAGDALCEAILIHTSVKLVTNEPGLAFLGIAILIHTSVKLVTRARAYGRHRIPHFNPHEREARDVLDKYRLSGYKYFNPHEREARDAFAGRTCSPALF